jgi:hypothetical protein
MIIRKNPESCCQAWSGSNKKSTLSVKNVEGTRENVSFRMLNLLGKKFVFSVSYPELALSLIPQ